MFWSAGCSLLRAEVFSRSLKFPYKGIGISKLQFLIKKYIKKFSAVNFFQFLVGIGSVFSLKCWIRIRIKWIRIGNTGTRYVVVVTLVCSGAWLAARLAVEGERIMPPILLAPFLLATSRMSVKRKSTSSYPFPHSTSSAATSMLSIRHTKLDRARVQPQSTYFY